MRDWHKHNFMKNWLTALLTAPPPPGTQAAILHDENCRFFKGGYCDCKAEVLYYTLPEANDPRQGH